jgi:hypothetical protein
MRKKYINEKVVATGVTIQITPQIANKIPKITDKTVILNILLIFVLSKRLYKNIISV